VSLEIPKNVAFDALRKLLISHYSRTTNQHLERTHFRSISGKEGESIVDFQIRIAARDCKFGNLLEDNLLEQFITGVNHPTLTRKLVEKADTTTLAEAMEVAATVQLLEGEMITATPTAASNVVARVTNFQNKKMNTTKNHKKKTHTTSTRNVICFRCFKVGHKSSDESCPALSKTRRDCKMIGHYAGSKNCRSKTTSKSTTNTVQHTPVESDVTPMAVDSLSNQFAVRNENSYKTP